MYEFSFFSCFFPLQPKDQGGSGRNEAKDGDQGSID